MAYGRAGSVTGESLPHPLAHGRVRLFLGVMLVAILVIALRMVSVQVVSRGEYLAIDRDIHRGPTPESPMPGGIYARDLEPMAVSVALSSITANPVQIAGTELGISGTARAIAECTTLDASEVRETLERASERGSKFTYLARLLQSEEVAELSRARIDGVAIVREYARVYPGERVACHVLGRRSSFHEPLDGIELRWSFLLEGKRGTRPRHMDSYGRSILGADSASVLPPEPGRNLVLSLDWELQQVAELALDEAMKQKQPQSATCTVMDPSTGEILALASRPNFDPSGLEQGSPEEIAARLKNLPVVRQYEPGSLFKVLLAAAAIESGKLTGNKSYYCSGRSMVGGLPLRCWDDRGHGSCGLTRMISHSCNIAAAPFAILVGAEYYHDFVTRLGFGERTGIELPGEASGSLRPADQMRTRDLASLGFGHGIAVSDIQMLNAICAVVNGGHLMQPHILNAVVDAATNQVIREIEPLELRRVCSEETSARVRELMGAVVDGGTGARARIEGLEVGGKTGTAQKWIREEGFVRGRNIVSFVLVAPLDRPRVAILVTADEPAVGEHGADVAAPVARTVAMAALRTAGLLPEQVEINEDAGI